MRRYPLRGGAVATVTRGVHRTDIHLTGPDGRTISSLSLPHPAADVLISQMRGRVNAQVPVQS